MRWVYEKKYFASLTSGLIGLVILLLLSFPVNTAELEVSDGYYGTIQNGNKFLSGSKLDVHYGQSVTLKITDNLPGNVFQARGTCSNGNAFCFDVVVYNASQVEIDRFEDAVSTWQVKTSNVSDGIAIEDSDNLGSGLFVVFPDRIDPMNGSEGSYNVQGSSDAFKEDDANAVSTFLEESSDTSAPTMVITATEVSDGDTSNDGTLSLTFTSSESTSNFAVGDITVSGGSLSDFSGSGSTYTATFTPSGVGATTIDVGAGTYTDTAGNDNTAATQFNWTYDNVAPTMVITATEVSDGDTSNDGTLSLTFTSSESTSNFAVGDITVSGGSLSDFSGSGSTYTATFTPSGVGATTIDVGAGTYTDTAGNDNTAATQFNWTYDNVAPTMVITATEVSDGDTSNDGTLSLTFTSSESTSNFAVGDITVSGGSLSDFSGSGSTYTATFTPSGVGATTIDVGAGTYTDTAGNDNTAATQFNWTYDNVAPTMVITATEVSDGDTSNDGTLSLTFTSSESTSNFAVGDITVSGGSLSDFSGSGSTYTATFTPSGVGATTIDVGAGTYTDTAGNDNTAATQFNWTYDNVAPTMVITATEVSDGDTSNDGTLSLTFTSSESTSNFAVGDITVSGGSLSDFSGSGSTYTATFTPSGVGATTIDVGAGTYTDTAGNDNTAATQFNWTYDNVAPTMVITATEVSDGDTSNDGTLSLTFTSSESTSNFAVGDITVSGGSLSDFSGSGSTYTATFTPSGVGATTIDVGAGTYTDTAGNDNTAATQFNWTYDNVAPTMVITATEVSDGDTSNDGTLSLTFTSSESTSNFAVGDITVSGGSLSDFSGSGSTYTATFTPSGVGATTIDVGAGTYTDTAGNDNTAATQFNWTYDNVAPTMVITATEVSDGDTSNDGTLSLTFTSSESTSNFAVGDITVSGGSLSDFSGSGSTYTATFTPSGVGATTIDVGAGTYTDTAGNDNTAATQFNWTYDNVAPTMVITATEVSDGDTSNDGTLSLTFTSSESTSNFAVGDITVSGGSLSDFSGSGSTYTATFTPSGVGATTIDVGAGTYTDTAGNDNTAATQFNWTYDNDSSDTTTPTITGPDGSGGTTTGLTSAITVNENQTAVTPMSATDDVTAGGDIVWSLSGADNALFTIAGDGTITFKAAPDYESPGDSGDTAGNNTYVIVITATDEASNATTQTLTVTVADIDEVTPTITGPDGSGGTTTGLTSAITVNENQTAVTPMSATDDVTAGGDIVWSLSGADNALFTIAGDGTITFKAAPDYESPGDSGDTAGNNTYVIVITATDEASNATTQTLTVTVADIDEVTPTITGPDGSGGTTTGLTSAITVNENQTAVTPMSATDDVTAGGDIVWSLSGADNALFTIAGDGTITFKAAPDYESPGDSGDTAGNNTYVIVITATDEASNATTQTLTVTVADIDEVTPTITGPDGSGGTTTGLTSAITVNENQTAVTPMSATDDVTAGGDIVWSLSGADNALFTIAGDGTITFKAAPDYESPGDSGDTAGNNTYVIVITATDEASNATTQTLTVTVADIDEVTPTITGPDGSGGTTTGLTSAITVNENQTAVTPMSATDDVTAGGDIVWSLSGADNALFTIAGDGTITFKAAPDYESPGDSGDTAGNNTYVIVITATDEASNATTQTLTVTVADIDEVTPTITGPDGSGGTTTGLTSAITVNENQTAVTPMSATDDVTAGGDIVWSLSGADNALFTIAGDGTITFKAAPDYESPGDSGDTAGNNTYVIVITATDEASNATTQTLTVTVADIDEVTPTITGPDGSGGTTTGLTSAITVNENQTAVTPMSATDDVTAGGDIVWSLSGADNALFTIAGDGTITFKAAPDYESPGDSGDTAGNNTYVIVITATDEASNATTQTLTVTVADIDEVTPTITGPDGSGGTTTGLTSAITVNENQTAVTPMSATDDVTAGGDIVWSLSGADNALFTIAGDGTITFKAAPDYESPGDSGDTAGNNTYVIVITATDEASNATTQTLTVTVAQVYYPGEELPPDIDEDGDGIADSIESSTADRDGDGIVDSKDYDPQGYFYCQADGRILSGGEITVSGPGNVNMVKNGNEGEYQWFVDAAGTYVMSVDTSGMEFGGIAQSSAGSMTIANFVGNPIVIGSTENANTGYLGEYNGAAYDPENPTVYYTTFIIAEGDANVLANNIPFESCSEKEVSIIASTNGIEPNGDMKQDGMFTVSLTKESDADTILSYTIGGSATSGEDYEPPNGSVTIPAGETSSTISIPILEDNFQEGNESITVMLVAVNAGDSMTVISNDAFASILITEDLTDQIRDDLKNILNDDMRGAVDGQQFFIAENSKNALSMLRSFNQENFECIDKNNTNSNGDGLASTAKIEAQAQYYSDEYDCINNIWSKRDGSLQLNYIKNFGPQYGVNYSLQKFQLTSERKVLGKFLGIYGTRSTISDSAVGNITGLGVNMGVSGSILLKRRKYLDYYAGAIIGSHRFNLAFPVDSGIDVAGNYSYGSVIAGAAYTIEALEFDKKQFELFSRMGFDISFANSLTGIISATQGSTTDSETLKLDLYRKLRVFAEVEVKNQDIVSEVANPKRQFGYDVTPRVICDLISPSTMFNCGYGAKLSFESQDYDKGTAIEFAVKAERVGRIENIKINLSRSRELFKGAGSIAYNIGVNESGSLSFGQTIKVEF